MAFFAKFECFCNWTELNYLHLTLYHWRPIKTTYMYIVAYMKLCVYTYIFIFYCRFSENTHLFCQNLLLHSLQMLHVILHWNKLNYSPLYHSWVNWIIPLCIIGDKSNLCISLITIYYMSHCTLILCWKFKKSLDMCCVSLKLLNLSPFILKILLQLKTVFNTIRNVTPRT